jgi:hypothetical protein
MMSAAPARTSVRTAAWRRLTSRIALQEWSIAHLGDVTASQEAYDEATRETRPQ